MNITLTELTLFFTAFILIGGLCDILIDKLTK